MIKNRQVLAYSDLTMVRLISTNKTYEPEEHLLSEMIVNGKVIGERLWT